jgi:hypothetical protein
MLLAPLHWQRFFIKSKAMARGQQLNSFWWAGVRGLPAVAARLPCDDIQERHPAQATTWVQAYAVFRRMTQLKQIMRGSYNLPIFPGYFALAGCFTQLPRVFDAVSRGVSFRQGILRIFPGCFASPGRFRLPVYKS